MTNIGHIVILSYTWKIACTNASSVVTVASNESGMDLFLSVAQAVGSHHIVTGSIKNDMEKRAHLSQGALSLAWVLAQGEEEEKEKGEYWRTG